MACILRRPGVEAKTGLSRSGIYDLMKAGKFPRPVPLGGKKAVGWLESEIEAWIEERIAERGEVSRLILGLILFFLVAISAGQPVAARQEVAEMAAFTTTTNKQPAEATTFGGLILVFSTTPLTHRKDSDDALIQTHVARVHI